MKNTKRFLWKTRRLFAVVFALIMVLGIVPISALPTQAAPDDENNVYIVRWPVENPVGSVRIHYVDENDDPIAVGTNEIGVEGDPANVKSIHDPGEDGDAMLESGQLGRNLKAFDLLKLINTTDTQSKYYNSAFANLMFKQAYIIKNGKKEVINPMLFSLNSENNDGDVTMRYSETWSEIPYGGTVSEDELNKTSPVITNGPDPGLEIYLMYKPKSGPTEVKTTVNNSEIGLVEMYMFDYPSENAMWADGYHHWTQADILTELYSDELVNGYPIYYGEAPDHTANRSLAEYFTPGNEYYVGTADKLFQLNSENGKYYYNSAWNSAYYNKDIQEFTLYEEKVAQRAKDPGIFARTAWKKGNFYPYDLININDVVATNIDADLKGTPVYGVQEENPNLNGDADINCYFGMYMIGNIFQPKNGQSIINEIGANGEITPKVDANGDPITQDMTFTIRGDDDILVYIDDVLVLDLGGIHDPLEGTINFANGDVKLYNGNGREEYTSTLKEKLINKGSLNGRKLTEADFKAGTNTFLNYSVHTMKIFYAERGGGASNLFVELNAPTKPSLPVKNSFWLDNKVTPGKNYTEKFNKMDNNINDAQYILEQLVDVDGYALGYEVKLVDEDGIEKSIETTKLADGVSYPLDLNKKYHIEITGTKNGIPTTIKSDEIVGSATQNNINLYTETIKGKNYLVYNVQAVTYGDDAFNKDADGYGGNYEFKDLDYTKQYRLVQQLYTLDNNRNIHPADGSSVKYPYEFTDLAINDNVTATNDKKLAQRVVTDIIGFLDDSNVLHYPTVEFKNVYTEVTLTKKIYKNGTDVDYASVSDGGDIIYDIESYVPNYSNYPDDTNIVYQIYDEPDNRLTYNLNADDFVTVKVGETTLSRNTDYTVNEENDEGKTYIVLTLKKSENYPNENINVTYKMQYDGDDETPIENIAFTKFTVTPNAEENDPDATGESNEDEAIAYTFDFAIRKTGTTVNEAQNIPVPLAGAEFTLYKGAVSEANKIGTEKRTTATANTSFTGLEEGTYILKETKVPDGYDALTDAESEHNVKINATYDNDGKIKTYTVTLDRTEMVYTAEYDNDGEFVRYTTDNGQNAFTIENTKTLGEASRSTMYSSIWMQMGKM